MKKLQCGSENKNNLLIHATVFAIVLFVFSGCDLFTYKRVFDDAYYDDNFIASIGFDKFVGDVAVVPATPTVGSWDFPYRYDGWSPTFDYMTRTPTGQNASFYGSASGLEPSAPVYRLEMVNLVSGGDFEGGAGAWAPSAPGASATLNPSGINGQSMDLSLDGLSNYVTYTLVPVASQFVAGDSYSVDFRWDSSSAPPTGAANQFSINGSSIDFNVVTGHATGSFIAAATNTITFKTTNTWTVTVDDITVKKAKPYQLRLLLAKKSTTPDLQDFLYKFSFWVYADPSVGVSTSPYHLDRIGINMLATPYSTISKDPDPDYVYAATPTGWHKKTVQVDNGNLQIYSNTAAVLELVVALDFSLPGSILIAQPELRAYPDGY